MVAADCSVLDNAFPNPLKVISAGHRMDLDVKSRPTDVLDTMRVLIEHGESDPTIFDSYGLTALHHFNGRSEPFSYLFQQYFQLDSLQFENGSFALAEYHAGKCWNNKLTIAMLALEQERLHWERTFHSRERMAVRLAEIWSDVLHTAARRMVGMHYGIEDDAESIAEVGNVIKQAVANGVDVHKITRSSGFIGKYDVTPLDNVILNTGLIASPGGAAAKAAAAKSAIAILEKWLNVLKHAGIDLKKYVKEEEKLAVLHKKNEVWELGYLPYDCFRVTWYRVNWQIEVSEDQEDYSISIEYEFQEVLRKVRSEEEEKEARIPGSWIEASPCTILLEPPPTSSSPVKNENTEY